MQTDVSITKELSRFVSDVLSKGYQINPDAFLLLRTLPTDTNFEGLLERVMVEKGQSSDDKVIRSADVRSALGSPAAESAGSVQGGHESESGAEVVSDPTAKILPREAEKGFKKLFEDRYLRLMSITKRRPDAKNMISTSSANRLRVGEKGKVGGLVSSKTSRKSGVEVVVDDPGGSARIICSDVRVAEAAARVPLDGFVMVEVHKSKSGQLYANSVSLPDIPSSRFGGPGRKAYAVLLSDLHVGSRMFLEEDFERFLQWLNGESGDVDLVKRVRYVLVAGDVVDGVGVYPGQEYQLSEVDLKKQYLIAARLLSKIPKHVQVFVSPGNHDSVRQALPQPALPRDLGEGLYSISNVQLVGNPSWIKLDGVTFLMYHGRSLDDIIATIPGLSYDRPAAAMQVLLRARHLAPIYGKRTAISPEERDMLVIDPVPDVFHSGHVHTIDALEYRGCVIVNSGTWQAQTSFQANMGLDPTPSIFPIVDLSSLAVIRRSMRTYGPSSSS